MSGGNEGQALQRQRFSAPTSRLVQRNDSAPHSLDHNVKAAIPFAQCLELADLQADDGRMPSGG
jgi:hypothetical protein